MGIFSHFRKKDRPPLSVADKAPSHRGRPFAADLAARSDTLDLPDPPTVQRDIARATALKIDAIESEMTLEFVSTTQLGYDANTEIPATEEDATTGATGSVQGQIPALAEFEPAVPLVFEPAAPAAPAANLPCPPAANDAAALPAELPSAPALEEAAILFASNQAALAAQILQDAIRDDALDGAAPLAWNMLFDLYQVTGQRAHFDTLSLAYAGKFETSPPSWRDTPALVEAAGSKPAASPSIAFSGVLDAHSAKQLARVQKLAESHTLLRLEFSRLSAVDPVGCGLLLRVLKKLQKSGLELILVGAPELAIKIRAILAVGRRDETEAPWLLLLEVLQLLNREQEFEEASIDYCVTFEVSPPAFVAPKTRISTAQEEVPGAAADGADPARLLMPVVIEGDTQHLMETIVDYAGKHQPLILDCQQLTRIDFSAAGPLLSGLATLSGKAIELHDVNHLIIALLQTLGVQHSVRLVPRKN